MRAFNLCRLLFHDAQMLAYAGSWFVSLLGSLFAHNELLSPLSTWQFALAILAPVFSPPEATARPLPACGL